MGRSGEAMMRFLVLVLVVAVVTIDGNGDNLDMSEEVGVAHTQLPALSGKPSEGGVSATKDKNMAGNTLVQRGQNLGEGVQDKDDAKKEVSYNKTPSMQFTVAAHEIKSIGLRRCRERCDMKKGCLSFSYNTPKRVCSWSTETIGFDPEWTYYQKTSSGGYASIASVRYFTEKGMSTKSASLDQCKKSCAKGKCNGLSFSEKLKKCSLFRGSGAGFRMDRDWSFYQKPNGHLANFSKKLTAKVLPAEKKAAMAKKNARLGKIE